MDDRWIGFFAGIGTALAVLIVFVFVDSVPNMPAPLPVSGRVAEKIEASTGHNNTVYVLKIERASEWFVYIVVTAQVWHGVLTGVQYNFEIGGKGGYDSAVEAVRE